MSATAGLEEVSVSHTTKLVCQPCSAASDNIQGADLFLKYTSANQNPLIPKSLEKVTAAEFLNLALIINFSFQAVGKLIFFQVTV